MNEFDHGGLEVKGQELDFSVDFQPTIRIISELIRYI